MDPAALALAEKLRLIEKLRNLYAWREHFGVLAEAQEELERSSIQPQRREAAQGDHREEAE
jgi:hypothetical protein